MTGMQCSAVWQSCEAVRLPLHLLGAGQLAAWPAICPKAASEAPSGDLRNRADADSEGNAQQNLASRIRTSMSALPARHDVLGSADV